MALAALFAYTAESMYTKRIEHRAGLMHALSLELADGFRQCIEKREGWDSLSDPIAIERELSFNLAAWTREIPETEHETDPLEANRDPDDDPERRVRRKRVIKGRCFRETS